MRMNSDKKNRMIRMNSDKKNRMMQMNSDKKKGIFRSVQPLIAITML